MPGQLLPTVQKREDLAITALDLQALAPFRHSMNNIFSFRMTHIEY